MKLSARGIALIKRFEACVLRAYRCPAGVWTIGWGHTGPDVVEGLTWTQEQADEALVNDLARFEDGVRRLLKPGVTLTDGQFSALVSLAYNIGLGAFSDSTALRRVNGGDLAAVPAAIKLWNKITYNGKRIVSPGLVNRRNAEAELWEGVHV